MTTAQPRRRRPFKALERWAGYGLLKAIHWLVNALPDRGVSWLGARLGDLFFRASARYRRITLANLKLIYPEMTDRERFAFASRVCRNFGKTAAEFLRLTGMSDAEAACRARAEGLEHVDAALARGKGVVILSAHFGNWEYLPLVLDRDRHPLNAMVRDPELPQLADFIRSVRASRGPTIHPKQNTLAAVRALKQNRLLLILADQHDWRGVLVSFFGHPARAATGPAAFVHLTDAAVVPMFAFRGDDDVITVRFYPALDLVATGNREADTARWTQQMTDFTADRVREAPEQWEWFHDRWRPDCYLGGSGQSPREALAAGHGPTTPAYSRGETQHAASPSTLAIS